MKYHPYKQPYLVDLPDTATVEDIKSLAYFNRIIKNYLKMLLIEEENEHSVSSSR